MTAASRVAGVLGTSAFSRPRPTVPPLMRHIRECHDGLLESAVADRIVAAFRAVRDALGDGHAGSVYQRALGIELTKRGVESRLDAPVEVRYDGTVVGVFRADLLVEHRILVGVHTGRPVAVAAESHLRHLLRAADLDVALLLHFGPRPACRRILRGGPPRPLTAVPSRPFAGVPRRPVTAGLPPAPGPCPVPPRAAYPTP